ncbi:YbhB/YbcL family Raf kinase inhibitor-like protein [Stutzerimonas zhaodongensis]|uniref:YbhB/YbcL family Raf kinase inhibitor-like protein n=1 Tax=Stutzerimonas TaxID=2901164 RepID=UPI00388EAD03
MRSVPFALAMFLLPGAASAESLPAQLKDPKSSDVKIIGHIVQPEPKTIPVSQLDVPPGFEVQIFAEDLVNPRMLAVHDSGTVYVTRRKLGDVLMLRDTDGDGRADERRIVANRPNAHGIAIDGDTLYLVTIKELYKTRIQPDGSLAPLQRLLADLPDAGQHPNRTLVVGPDKQLYLSVGSTCNACADDNPENATLLQVKPDGSSRKIYASGLRNTIGFGFEPSSGALYGMDHGMDWLGDNVQHEELNLIQQGKNYGWPYIYEEDGINPADQPPGKLTHKQWAARSVAPVGLYVPHSAPMQMAFYTSDQFPEDYRGDAFVAMRGSWNRRPPSGYEVLRIRFEDGKPTGFEPLVSGFLVEDGDGWARSARLAGIAQAKDGALLVSDDDNGVIYRVSYTGQATADGATSDRQPTYAEGTRVGMLEGPQSKLEAKPEKLAKLSRVILEAQGSSLQLESATFQDGTTLPSEQAAEQDNVSPALRWKAGPDGTQSYAVIMEDPDVSSEPPFVHWLLYNLPADTTELSSGVPGAAALEMPDGALQGRNDHGSLGYYGPRPPKGAPAHHYHFQVFALDRQLDLPHAASRAELLEAMRGHVLASDELVGRYSR